MSLYNFVYNLQRKNNKAKKRILVSLLACSFLLLMFFWVVMFKNQLQKIDLSQGSGAAKLLGEEEKMVSPLAALVQGFKSFKKEASDKMGEYGNMVSKKEEVKIENNRPVYELPVE
mgnify:FL=1